MSKNRTVTYKTDYMSHRPFMVITETMRPASWVKTHIKGWAENPDNWQREENPVLVDRVTTKHLKQAVVIIDMLNSTLVKNRFNDSTKDEVFAIYAAKYATQITQGMEMWRNRVGLPLATPVEAAEITVTI